MPPIGGLTVYCFGDPEKMADESVRLALRIHDEVCFVRSRLILRCVSLLNQAHLLV